jgi:hypothetical protein
MTIHQVGMTIRRLDASSDELAVVNTTGQHVTATWGGKSMVLYAADISPESNFPCIQRCLRNDATGFVGNQSRFLHTMEIQDAEKLLALARDKHAEGHGHESFFIAYEEFFGFPPNREGEMANRAYMSESYDKQLTMAGIVIDPDWSVEQKKAILRDKRLAYQPVKPKHAAAKQPVALTVDSPLPALVAAAKGTGLKAPVMPPSGPTRAEAEVDRLRARSDELGIGWHQRMIPAAMMARIEAYERGESVEMYSPTHKRVGLGTKPEAAVSA